LTHCFNAAPKFLPNPQDFWGPKARARGLQVHGKRKPEQGETKDAESTAEVTYITPKGLERRLREPL